MALSFRRACLRTSRKDLALRLATPSQYPGDFSGYLRDVVCCRRDQVMRFCSLAFGWDREACLAAALEDASDIEGSRGRHPLPPLQAGELSHLEFMRRRQTVAGEPHMLSEPQ